MAAGQGFKTFTTGEVLTAGDVNGYLMQGINVFTNATARDAAITAPAEGQFAFTKDNNSLWYYDGAAWVASGATGDIEGVTATSPLTGGGTSGTVTVGIQDASTAQRGSVQLSDSTSTTSSVLAATSTAVKSAYDLAAAAIPKSTVTTAGDVIYATGSSAVTRLGIGSTGQVLTVAGGVPSWATAASGSTFAGVRLRLSGSQSIPNATDTVLNYTVENFDTNSYHDNTTNNSRITIPAGKAGYYLVFGTVNYSQVANGARVHEILYNNTTTIARDESLSNGGSIQVCHSISSVYYLAEADYIEHRLYQGSGGSLDALANHTQFGAVYLGV
jgi:hypothetical protein